MFVLFEFFSSRAGGTGVDLDERKVGVDRQPKGGARTKWGVPRVLGDVAIPPLLGVFKRGGTSKTPVRKFLGRTFNLQCAFWSDAGSVVPKSACDAAL